MLFPFHIAILAAVVIEATPVPDNTKQVFQPANAPFQYVPNIQTTPDNHFNSGTSRGGGLSPLVNEPVPEVYQLREIDIPFGIMRQGKAVYFTENETNEPGSNKDVWNPGKNDFASQSACGIPNNAWFISHAAIHPYWLKYADLSRYCMQDVCISFWGASGRDGMVKVTDVCSTDPKDESYCESPSDLKLDRKKIEIVETGAAQHTLGGTQYPTPIKWFFVKCWDDGLAQSQYSGPGTKNWFTTPYLPNKGEHGKTSWSWDTSQAQMNQNKKSYPQKGWKVEENAQFYKISDTNVWPVDDYKPGDAVPEWCPVAGGKGHGHPTGKNCGGTGAGVAMVNETAAEESSQPAPSVKPIIIDKETSAEKLPAEKGKARASSTVEPTEATPSTGASRDIPSPSSSSAIEAIPTASLDSPAISSSGGSEKTHSKTEDTSPGRMHEGAASFEEKKSTEPSDKTSAKNKVEDDDEQDTCES